MISLLQRPGLLTLAIYSLILLPMTGAHATVTSASAAQEWRFRVLLDDREIGFHDFRVTGPEDRRRVEIEAEFDVRILFLNAYRYRHRTVELWNDDCLTTMESRTDDNGTLTEVRARSAGDRFLVRTRDEQAELRDCVMSFAYWNPDLLQADRLLNSQTGEMQTVTIEPRGETLLRVDGAELPARQYDLSVGDTVISLWYAVEDYRWLALETPARGGRTLRYEPVAIPPRPAGPATARRSPAASERG